MRYSAIAILTSIIFTVAGVGTAQPPAKGKPDPKDPKNKVDPKAKGEQESEFNMKLTVGDIILGQHVCGEKIEKGDLKNRVVLVDYWGSTAVRVFN